MGTMQTLPLLSKYPNRLIAVPLKLPHYREYHLVYRQHLDGTKSKTLLFNNVMLLGEIAIVSSVKFNIY